jgi:hypothetical protein
MGSITEVGERAYEIVTRVYGRDGVMGTLEPQRGGGVGGHEAFILWDVISESQVFSRNGANSAIFPPICAPADRDRRRSRCLHTSF